MYFDNATAAFNFIQAHKATGNERTINDSIHFGISIYIYNSDVNDLRSIKIFNTEKGLNGLFVSFPSDEDLLLCLEAMEIKDGILHLDNSTEEDEEY